MDEPVENKWKLKRRNEYVFLEGMLKWVKGHQPDPWGNWKVNLYPTPPSMEKIRELQAEGMKNVLRKDEDGYNITFRRPSQKLINGKVQGFTPPEILDGTNGPKEDGSFPPMVTPIGNGSTGIVKLQVYEHRLPPPSIGKAKAARWESLRVDTLVPWEKAEDFTEDQIRAVRGLEEHAKQLW